MLQEINEETVPSEYRSGFAIGNFRPGKLYFQVIGRALPITGVNCKRYNTIADYLGKVMYQSSDQNLPEPPPGLFSLDELGHNMIRATYAADDISAQEVIKFVKSLGF